MIEILTRIMAIIERVRNMEELSVIATGVFGIILVFGILNCLLGYRLLRFWMMLGGFGVGAGAGLFIASTLEVSGRGAYLGIMAVTGIVLGGIAFLSYKVGVFVLGAGIGVSLSVYILHPTTSFVFFICLLLGVGLGSLAVRYSREVLIVSTSLMGGVMAGFSLAKIGEMDEFPYGVLMSIGFAILGMLIQFDTNKPSYKEEKTYRKEEGRERATERYYDEYDMDDDWYPGKEEDSKEKRSAKDHRDSRKDSYLDEMGDGLESYLDTYVDVYDREDTQRYDIRRGEKTITVPKKIKK